MSRMKFRTKCPICDAEPGDPCYDPHGKLPFKDMHAARFENERKRPDE